MALPNNIGYVLEIENFSFVFNRIDLSQNPDNPFADTVINFVTEICLIIFGIFYACLFLTIMIIFLAVVFLPLSIIWPAFLEVAFGWALVLLTVGFWVLAVDGLCFIFNVFLVFLFYFILAP